MVEQEFPEEQAQPAAEVAPAAAEAPAEAAAPAEGQQAARRPRTREERREYYRERSSRRKVCPFCAERVAVIDYKDVARLRRFLSERAKIEPRRKTNTCAKHQRQLARAMKRARYMALLPYTAEHIRLMGLPE